MTSKIYAWKDTKIAFKNPFLQQNEAVAMRTAKWTANDQEEHAIEDIELWQLGEYDDETGRITPCEPKYIVKLIDLRSKKNDE